MRIRCMEAIYAGIVGAMLGGSAQAADVDLQARINATPAGGTLTLNASDRYIGNATFARNMTVVGNGATIDLISAAGYRALRVDAGVTLTLNNVIIKNANIGMIVYEGAKFTFAGGTIRDCETAIAINSGTVGLTNSQVLGCTDTGLKIGVTGPGDVTLTNTTISACNVGATLIRGSINAQGSTWQNQPQGIAGNGDLSLSNCTFNNVADLALNMKAADGSLDYPEIVVSGCNFTGGNTALQLSRCRVAVTSSTFRNMNQAVALLDNRVAKSGATAGKALPERVELTNNTFSDIGLFGILVRAGQASITNSTLTRVLIPIELEQAANATITGTTIYSDTIYKPGVGIAVHEGSTATIRNTTVRRHMNSIDIQEGSSATVEDCLLDNPIFSGLILARNSHMTVRRVEFRRNGQDAIAENSRTPGQAATDASAAPCTALVEDCYFNEAGTEPPNPDYNIDVQVGGGLIFEGGGPFVVRNCFIERCHGNGFGLGFDAVVEATGNVIWRNDLAAFSVGEVASLTSRDNTVFGSAGQQAGMNITFSDRPIRVLSERNWYAENGFGVLHSNPGHDQTYRDDVFFRNRGQGLSVAHRGALANGQEGTVFAERSVFLENGGPTEGFQIYVRSQGQSIFKDGMIFASNREGLYTQRGACNNVSGVPSIATGNYWGNAAGPINSCLSGVPAGSTGYQNALVTPFASAPNTEVFYWLNPHSDPPYRVSVDSRPWLQVSLSAASQNDTFLAATRNTSRNILAVTPQHAVDTRAIAIQTSRVFRNLPGTVTLSLTTNAIKNKSPRLERVDPATGATLDSVDGRYSPEGNAIFVVPTSRLVNGCYYLTDNRPATIEPLLSTRPATPADDLTGDGVVDAADAASSVQ